MAAPPQCGGFLIWLVLRARHSTSLDHTRLWRHLMNSSRHSRTLSKAKLADAEISRGAGGETHQTAERGMDVLTTQ
ncbi:MAG TPA: hypothetical protein VGI28_01095, partial [Stellaceae bacterium]